jgi:hypothetical protein
MAMSNRVNRLRFVDILRPHIGDRSAREFAEALDDETARLATKDDLEHLGDKLRADIYRIAMISAALWGTFLTIAVAIIKFA